MKTKLVLWGLNADDERVLFAISLNPDKNNVTIYTIPEKIITPELETRLMNEWRNGVEVEFPEETISLDRDLSVSENLLPDDLKVDRTDIINRAQTEWHFIVLSAKLHTAYKEELEELKERVEKLEVFDNGVWDSMREFWDKVQHQIYDRNLFREHADSLKAKTNEIFGKLKKMRAELDNEFEGKSKEYLEKFNAELEEIEEKIKKGVNLRSVFNDLKNIQKSFKDTKLIREHRSKIWKKLDNAFKAVKEELFGADATKRKSPEDRLKRRYDGLQGAINRMESSIKRDRNELEFQKKRIEESDGQLEAQIRQAKIKMIEERISSKSSKLDDMLKTREQLEDRIQKRKLKEEALKLKEEAKKEAKERIAQQIKEQAVARKEEVDKLKKAADSIKQKDTEKEEGQKSEKEKEPSTIEAVGTLLEETFEDVIDTVKAVAQVVGGKIEDKIEEIKEDLEQKGDVSKDPNQGDEVKEEAKSDTSEDKGKDEAVEVKPKKKPAKKKSSTKKKKEAPVEKVIEEEIIEESIEKVDTVEELPKEEEE